MRRRLAPVVASGNVPCVRFGKLIEPGTPWQLHHRDDGRGWLGPAHHACNARAGWSKMVASANGHGIGLEEKPYRWSQRWADDPPPGTTVNISGSEFVEMYLGNGVWQTVNRRSVATSRRGDVVRARGLQAASFAFGEVEDGGRGKRVPLHPSESVSCTRLAR